jgi:sec-independent protein translocase protein TatA
MPGSWEWIIIVVIALLIFGKRLPDVARSVGKSIIEFKKGIKDVKEDIEDQSRLEAPSKPRIEAKPPAADSSAGSTPSSSTAAPAATESAAQKPSPSQ